MEEGLDCYEGQGGSPLQPDPYSLSVTETECRAACSPGGAGSEDLPSPVTGYGGGIGMPGGHSTVPVDAEIETVASQSNALLAGVGHITGPVCDHARMLEVVSTKETYYKLNHKFHKLLSNLQLQSIYSVQ